MPSVCFYFQVHQPYRIKNYTFFDIGKDSSYFDTDEQGNLSNRFVMQKVAKKCYIPTNRLLFKLLKKYPEFRFTFSFSGIALEQMEKYAPEALESFRDLISTGRVEVLGETYYHSLSFLYSKEEFYKQVQMNREKVEDLFSIKQRVFRCTELAYSNDIAKEAEKMGFEGILGEGVDHILGWRSPNFIYKPNGSKIKLFLKNYKLSDDIAFRFSERSWKEYPLTADKFSRWVSNINGSGEIVNLFMDYETFGEHQWEETGIFKFLESLPGEVLRHPDNDFATLSEAIDRYDHRDEIDVPYITSWADMERDLSAWLGNEMQQDSLRKLYKLEKQVLETKDDEIIDQWRRFQTSDQVYYMCTKGMGDGTVHDYFSPYGSPYDAFICFTNALSDFKLRLDGIKKIKNKKVKTK